MPSSKKRKRANRLAAINASLPYPPLQQPNSPTSGTGSKVANGLPAFKYMAVSNQSSQGASFQLPALQGRPKSPITPLFTQGRGIHTLPPRPLPPSTPRSHSAFGPPSSTSTKPCPPTTPVTSVSNKLTTAAMTETSTNKHKQTKAQSVAVQSAAVLGKSIKAEIRDTRKAAGECIVRGAVYIFSREYAFMTRPLFMHLYRTLFGCPGLQGTDLSNDCGFLENKMIKTIVEVQVTDNVRYYRLKPTYFEELAQGAVSVPVKPQSKYFALDDKYNLPPVTPLNPTLMSRLAQEFDVKYISVAMLFPDLWPSVLDERVPIALQYYRRLLPMFYPELHPNVSHPGPPARTYTTQKQEQASSRSAALPKPLTHPLPACPSTANQKPDLSNGVDSKFQAHPQPSGLSAQSLTTLEQGPSPLPNRTPVKLETSPQPSSPSAQSPTTQKHGSSPLLNGVPLKSEISSDTSVQPLTPLTPRMQGLVPSPDAVRSKHQVHISPTSASAQPSMPKPSSSHTTAVIDPETYKSLLQFAQQRGTLAKRALKVLESYSGNLPSLEEDSDMDLDEDEAPGLPPVTHIEPVGAEAAHFVSGQESVYSQDNQGCATAEIASQDVPMNARKAEAETVTFMASAEGIRRQSQEQNQPCYGAEEGKRGASHDGSSSQRKDARDYPGASGDSGNDGGASTKEVISPGFVPPSGDGTFTLPRPLLPPLENLKMPWNKRDVPMGSEGLGQMMAGRLPHMSRDNILKRRREALDKIIEYTWKLPMMSLQAAWRVIIVRWQGWGFDELTGQDEDMDSRDEHDDSGQDDALEQVDNDPQGSTTSARLRMHHEMVQQMRMRAGFAPEPFPGDEDREEDEEREGDENDGPDDDGVGSSTGTRAPESILRIKKIGKKKAEQLRRKEQMRAYHEFMEMQRQERRQQEEMFRMQDALKQEERERKRVAQMEKDRQRKEQLKQDEAKENHTRMKQAHAERVKEENARRDLVDYLQRIKSFRLSELAKRLGRTEQQLLKDLAAVAQESESQPNCQDATDAAMVPRILLASSISTSSSPIAYASPPQTSRAHLLVLYDSVTDQYVVLDQTKLSEFADVVKTKGRIGKRELSLASETILETAPSIN
ncbi:hypothetical protein BG011_004628 [Mortierella polycephala]|uniref:Uncharacterized protein n=1 Tax=Mortierella polycephala TaxID=41804 RepID=A0A9P6PZC9_9FUNG|nr:hypothetical protein BG011_004628 [Mortierella polycephala]